MSFSFRGPNLIRDGFITLILGLVAFLAAHVFYIYHFAIKSPLLSLAAVPFRTIAVLGGIAMVAVWFVKSMFRDIAAHLKDSCKFLYCCSLHLTYRYSESNRICILGCSIFHHE